MFLCFNLPYTNHNDRKPTRRILLKIVIRKSTNDKYKLTKDIKGIVKDVKNLVIGIEWKVQY